MNSYEVIQLANKHIDNSINKESAILCLNDAIELQAKGKCTSARNRAVKSLQYSVGIFHKDYQLTKCI